MRWKKRGYVLTCCVVGIVITVMVTLKCTYSVRVFERYVLRPVPKSVKQIKVHRPWELSGHRYVMHFKIDRADVEKILAARAFKEMLPGVDYSQGNLDWTVSTKYGERNGKAHVSIESEGLSLYDPGQGPEWFRPQEWSQSCVYRFKERNTKYREHMQVLIYNEELGEAYLVEYQEGY